MRAVGRARTSPNRRRVAATEGALRVKAEEAVTAEAAQMVKAEVATVLVMRVVVAVTMVGAVASGAAEAA